MSDEYRVRCIHLSCKSMAVYGEDFEKDPEYQQGMVDFVCLCTQKSYGPDGASATLEDCREQGRGCFQDS